MLVPKYQCIYTAEIAAGNSMLTNFLVIPWVPWESKIVASSMQPEGQIKAAPRAFQSCRDYILTENEIQGALPPSQVSGKKVIFMKTVWKSIHFWWRCVFIFCLSHHWFFVLTLFDNTGSTTAINSDNSDNQFNWDWDN